MKRLFSYLQSFRIHHFPVLLCALLFGVFASSHTPTLTDYLVLAALSLFGHVFGYGINDSVDYPFDRNNPKHMQRISLVSRNYHRGRYLAFSLLQLPLMLILGYLFYGFGQSTLFVVLALSFITLYNLHGKRKGPLFLVAHLSFPLSEALLCLAGFTLFDPVSRITAPFILLLAAIFFNILLINSFSGSLQDFRFDTEAGAYSFARLLGSTISGNQVKISGTTKVAAMAIYDLSVALMLAQAVFNKVPVYVYPIALILLFYGYAHTTAYLKLDDASRLHTFDPGIGPAYLFFATSLAWINELPVIWWSIIAFALLGPLVNNREGRFGRETLRAFFIRANSPGPLS